MLTPVEFEQEILIRPGPERLKESAMLREAEIARKAAEKSALQLTNLLLKYPRRSELQEPPSMYLPDGRKMDVRLINTGEFNSIGELLQAKFPSDRIEINVRNEKGIQFGYSLVWSWGLPLQISDFRQYCQGCKLASVSSTALDTYQAYTGNIEVKFDPTQQVRVFTRCKEIFDIAHTLLTAQQSSTRLP